MFHVPVRKCVPDHQTGSAHAYTNIDRQKLNVYLIAQLNFLTWNIWLLKMRCSNQIVESENLNRKTKNFHSHI